MALPIPFLFEGEGLVRAMVRDGLPWFVAVDVCRLLGIQQPSRAVENLDADEKGVSITHTLGGDQEVLIVSESGLYALIFRSRKPAAVRFRKWVTGEVLPALRQGGGYVIPGGSLAAPEGEARNEWLDLRIVAEARLNFGPKVGREMWFRRGLPVVPSMQEPAAQPDLFDESAPPAEDPGRAAT